MNNKKGSALLVLLLVMTVLTLLVVQRLRSGNLSYDIVAMRLAQYKKEWAGRALLQYGLAWCKANKKELLQLPEGAKKELSISWPKSSSGTKGVVRVVRSNGGVTMEVMLQEDKKICYQQVCALEVTPLALIVKKMV